jgi:hypothetical protein
MLTFSSLMSPDWTLALLTAWITAVAGFGWDILMLVLILYNVFAVPVHICFDVRSPRLN